MILSNSFRLTLFKIVLDGNSATVLLTVESHLSGGEITNGVEFFLVAKVERLDLDTFHHRFR